MLNLFLHDLSFSQNLVPNPGFEIVDTCYNLFGGINLGLIPPWDSPTDGTADGYNLCSNLVGGGSTIPSNPFGYQYPHSGNGYVGAGFYGFDIWSTNCNSVNYYIEYLQVELDSPLVAHEKYCASFYVNHANRYYSAALGNFGMYFSAAHTYVPTTCELNYPAQIIEPNIVSDDSAWVLVYGQYMAQGGERYIIIGNFNSVSTSDTVHLVNTGFTADTYQAYYYIDDVNVHCCTCDSLDHTGINELTDINTLTISPNPANSEIKITTNDNLKLGEVKIYNSIGACVLLSPPLRGGKEGLLDISSLPQGLYFIEVITHKGIQRKKFVKQ